MKHFYFTLLLCWSGGLCSQSYFPPLTGTVWDTVSAGSLGWCEDKVQPLYDYLQTNNTKAFILLKDGKIVLEKYYGTFVRDSLWYWASAGKTLTAFMVGLAQQDGFLSIADTTSKYLGNGWTNCSQEEEDKITIWNQLTMTSGLDDGVADPYCTNSNCLSYKADAGTRWAYHNAPYTLLDGVILNATGQSLKNYVSQKLTTTTGMSGFFFPSGFNNVFLSTARSMARFGLLVLNKGIWNGNPVLTDTAYYRQMVNTSQNLNKSYGYLWWLNGKQSFMVPGLQVVIPGSLSPNAPADMIAALGKNGQMINVVPGMNLLYIRMGNAPGSGEVPILFNDTVWIKLNELMCNQTSITDVGDEKTGFKVYPNPVTGHFTVEIPDGVFDLSLHDIEGRCIFRQYNCSQSVKLSCESLKPGLFTLRAVSGENVWVSKLILQ